MIFPRFTLRTGLMAGALFALFPASDVLAESPVEEAITFTAQSGETVDAFRGELRVPENRSDPDSRMIAIRYLRFPATGEVAGPPIIYLAGGPGGSGSGTARGARFPLFMAMRQHGDVIAFDQRGTGLSDQPPACQSGAMSDDSVRRSDADIVAGYRSALEYCADFWAEAGVDLLGYTTAASVADLSDLREHLGGDRISLWGISYGSHLALAALNAIPDEIERVVIASAEGLDQTVKLPARTDAYFERLQAAIDSQPAAAALHPDLAGLMRRVHDQLEANPLLIELPQSDGSSLPFLLQRHHMQQFASGLIADPANAGMLPFLYRQVEAGDPTLITMLLSYFVTPGEGITLRAMPTAMDIASGVSAGRRALFEAQAETGLIGPYLNFPMPQLAGAIDGLDLGDGFRAGPTGDTPVLLLTGTLDGRTYPQAQVEAVAGLTNVSQVIVRNAGHNLFMTTPDVGEVMHEFMRGEAVTTTEIVIDLPDFSRHPFQR
ncbi:alpha/beta fold hydrolase [Maricaulis sp.]|uniref:alpha/beta fold hydrolase n=1 Tax=Maricaulis sp. TaxID=1486257 RepID=UPI0025BBB081|nr:alpha/beta fold hydrolase [Maricaulis sp.]